MTDENVQSAREILKALISEARIDATRRRTIRESLAILERAKKDGILTDGFSKDLQKLLSPA